MEDTDVSEGFKMTEIGLLPEEWKTGSLRKLNTKKKINLNPSDFPDEIFEYYSIPAYQDSGKPLLEKGSNILSQKIILEDGVVLFGKLNPRVEKVWKVQSNSQYRKVGSTEWIPIYPNENEVDSNYLYYVEWSSYVMPLAKTLVTGSTPSRQRVDLKSFYEIKIPLPPRSEQKQIAFVLSTIQQTIEKTEAVINAAKELKKSMMKHLFTYGPVSVEEAENVVLKETEIGLMPEEWKVVRLGDVVRERIKNGAFVKRNRFGKGVPFLNVADVYKNITVDLVFLERVECTNGELEFYGLQPNDLYYVRSSLKREGVGQCCIVEHIHEPAIFDCHLMRVRVNTKIIVPRFLAYYSVSFQGKSALIARSKTTTMTTINQDGLSGLYLPLPSYNEQERISQVLSTIDQKIESEQTKKKALEELFKTLLHNLMTGKIRVTHLEVPHD